MQTNKTNRTAAHKFKSLLLRQQKRASQQRCPFLLVERAAWIRKSNGPARVARQKQLSVVFDEAKPPKARSGQSRASAGDRSRLCDGGGRQSRENLSFSATNKNLAIPYFIRLCKVFSFIQKFRFIPFFRLFYPTKWCKNDVQKSAYI